MARTPRIYRAPVVVTLAAALLPSCGSGEPEDGTGGSGGSTGGGHAVGGAYSSGGKVGTGGKGPGGGPSTGGSHSTGGSAGEPSLPACPDDYFFPQINCVPTARCEMITDCTSGEPRPFHFTCTDAGDRWVFEGGDCENAHEFCDGIGSTECVDDAWLYQGQGGNPPSPCPDVLPAEGSNCSAGDGFGADPDACGYPCGDAWTVIGCVASSDEQVPGPGSWESDGACSGGGADGD